MSTRLYSTFGLLQRQHQPDQMWKPAQKKGVEEDRGGAAGRREEETFGIDSVSLLGSHCKAPKSSEEPRSGSSFSWEQKVYREIETSLWFKQGTHPRLSHTLQQKRSLCF